MHLALVGLLFAAGPASSFVVVVQSVHDVIRTPGTTVVASPVSPPYSIFVFFVGWFLKEKMPGTRGNNINNCLLLLAVFLRLNFVLLRVTFSAKQSVCTMAAW